MRLAIDPFDGRRLGVPVRGTRRPAPPEHSGPSAPARATAFGTAGPLRVGAATDPSEREAERIAGRVAGDGALSASPGASASRRAPAGDSEAGPGVPGSVRRVLARGGEPLPRGIRAGMEERFGWDLSKVRIHRDAAAHAASDDLGARAWTFGRHIAFGVGEYRPQTTEGRRVLAHELVHSVQQSVHPGPPTLRRLIRTPYPWRGVITPARGANFRSSRDHSSPSNIHYAIAQGDTVKVLGATGNWLQVEHKRGSTTTTGWIYHTLVDDAASRSLRAMVGSTMVWRPSGPGSGTDFEQWASAATEGTLTVTSSTVMNCWEAVLLAAYRSGAITWSWIHNLYTATPVADWVDAMSRSSRTVYRIPGPTPMPQRGDLVFFDGLAHVALATGNGSDVYTFWPPPDTPFTPGGTTDKVKVFTIEALVTWWTANMGSTPTVEFGAPAW